MVEGDGNVVRGDHTIADNVSTVNDDYAAHTLRANTGSIGVSMACMAGAVESPFNAGKFPMTETQWNRAIEVIAHLADFYHIPVTDKTILSHAEVQTNLGIQQRGKWDVARLPLDPKTVGAKACGNKMRERVKELL
ncbi:N-acetylmuramoyl-L-alanine amidase [Rhizobium sp. P32RR-XVIII]|nr:N-acetylmuramoyl-L-alanine amidase [Rhizobium sp. P32RR-XVIII]